MSFNWGPRHHESYEAGADLTEKQFLVVKRGSDGKVVVAGAGEGHGVLDNAPAAGETADLVTDGTTKVRAGGTIAINSPVIANADGEAIAATFGTSEGLIFGTAREAAVDGQIIAVRVDFSGAGVSAASA